jgi:hypothetical protein
MRIKVYFSCTNHKYPKRPATAASVVRPSHESSLEADHQDQPSALTKVICLINVLEIMSPGEDSTYILLEPGFLSEWDSQEPFV